MRTITDSKPSIQGSRGVYCPRGTFEHYEAALMVRDALMHCATHGARELLADLSEVTTTRLPSLVSRAEVLRMWKEAASEKVRLALVLKAELLNNGGFGNTFIRNIRFDAQIFRTVTEAIFWLEARAGDSVLPARQTMH